jgi:hypothetical protein
LLLLGVIAGLPSNGVQAAQFSIDAVKAAYLFRFASYVEWPPAADKALDKGEAVFTIGIVGAEDVAIHLERLLTGMSVGGRAAKVRRVRSADDLSGVRILYVGPGSFRGTRELRDRTRARPILVVTDDRLGLDGGGVINFLEIDRNLRFEISLDAAERNGLKIDSALLSVAARVAKKGE